MLFRSTLDVNGNIHCSNLYYSSDQRFKKNITPITNGLDKIEKINPVRFEWNEFVNQRRNGYKLNEPTIGVLAQEVEQVIPEIVDTWKLSDDCTDARSVSYAKLNMVLIVAVKELHGIVKDLQLKVSDLQSKVTAK